MNDKELYLRVDPDKLLFTNDGDSVYLRDEQEYKRYLSDHLGEGFSDFLVEERTSCSDVLEELLDDVCSAINDVEYTQKYRSNPIAELKSLRKAFETLTLCKSVLSTLLDD